MAYSLIKEIQKEIATSAAETDSGSDLESAPNLNHCKDAVASILNNFMLDGGSKKGGAGGDKVNKAQDIVEQAKKLMGENVKKMIDNQKDFNVSFTRRSLNCDAIGNGDKE